MGKISYFKVRLWCKQYKWNRESIHDDPNRIEEIITKLEDLLLAYHLVIVSSIAEEIRISKNSSQKFGNDGIPHCFFPQQELYRRLYEENFNWE